MAKIRPDLTRATRKITTLMQDTCQVLRDLEGRLDDVLDEDTGLYVSPTGDVQIVFDGPCFITPTGVGSTENSEQAATRNPGYRTLAAYLPLSAMGIEENDWLVMTSSLRDPELVGRRLRVIGLRYSTFAVARRLDMEDVR